MTFKIVMEPGEDGWIVAECPSLPGCVSQGRTETEAMGNIREAIQLWLETEVEKQVATVSAFLTVGFSHPPRAHGQKGTDRGYPACPVG